MALAGAAHGLMFPNWHMAPGIDVTVQSVGTLNAATNKIAFIGNIYINGRPAGAKTFSSAGGKIHFATGAVTWANTSTIVVGVQDLSTSLGPSATPDASFDVSDDLVRGTDAIAANSMISATMSSGSKSITHGDLIAVVLDMTVRGGGDSVVINGVLRSSNAGRPISKPFSAGAWGNPQQAAPGIVIEFDDGTLATLYGGFPVVTAGASESWQDSTNPDERGLAFQVPWDCKIDAFYASMGASAATADFVLTLYSTPFGTPGSVTSLSVLGEQMGLSTIQDCLFALPSEVSLTRNTDYVLAIRALDAGTVVWRPLTLAAAHRVLLPGYAGSSMAYCTRNNGGGAFTTTTTLMPRIGVMISSLYDSSGSGGGLRLAGHGGLAA